MPFVNVIRKGKIIRDGEDRIIVIPKDFVLEGEAITIMQDRWGEISIRPDSLEGRKALEKFNPFADWEDDETDG